MRNFLLPALLIALVMVMALLSLAVTPGDGARALPTQPNAYVDALRKGGPDVTAAAASAVNVTAAPTPVPSASHAAGASPIVSHGTTPVATSTPRLIPPIRWFRGQATWWFSFGHGYYVAVNPDLHIPNGTIVQVCDAQAQGCVPAPVITTCACLGRDSGRIVDLSLDLFSRFADPSAGITTVVLEVVQ